jgi:hypothetical protein
MKVCVGGCYYRSSVKRDEGVGQRLERGGGGGGGRIDGKCWVMRRLAGNPDEKVAEMKGRRKGMARSKNRVTFHTRASAGKY